MGTKDTRPSPGSPSPICTTCGKGGTTSRSAGTGPRPGLRKPRSETGAHPGRKGRQDTSGWTACIRGRPGRAERGLSHQCCRQRDPVSGRGHLREDQRGVSDPGAGRDPGELSIGIDLFWSPLEEGESEKNQDEIRSKTGVFAQGAFRPPGPRPAKRRRMWRR